MSVTANYTEIEALLSTREPFIGSSSRAYVSPWKITQGRLDDREYETLFEAFNRGTVTYVVYSYGTPIAWVADGRPHVVQQCFSQITSRIQRLCREYL